VAVWTGTQMIVWGGIQDQTGGVYCSASCTPSTWYGDSDHDGYGSAAVSVEVCHQPPAGYVSSAGDCDDAHASVHPGAPQLCDGINDDCSDPSWPAVPVNEADADADGFRICGGDCDDTRAAVKPGGSQLCDGLNDNCSDPSWPAVPANEADADDDGFRICANDCNDGNADIHPGVTETCNGIDDDCSGAFDDDGSGVDSDGDGVHNACDDCRFVANPTQIDSDADRVGDACDNCQSGVNPAQTDTDHDGQGDLCDLDDGLLYFTELFKNGRVDWQAETVYAQFNLYRGSLGVLRATGEYTQDPSSVPEATRFCFVGSATQMDPHLPPVGTSNFYLVTGLNGGGESSLGNASNGAPRPNAHPCP